jgi:hypothetical protein
MPEWSAGDTSRPADRSIAARVLLGISEIVVLRIKPIERAAAVELPQRSWGILPKFLTRPNNARALARFQPRRGRTKIARRFIAGNGQRERPESPGRDDRVIAPFGLGMPAQPPHRIRPLPRLPGLTGPTPLTNPAINRWAIIERPYRDLGAKHGHSENETHVVRKVRRRSTPFIELALGTLTLWQTSA